jgi:hypothetical protein
LGSEFKAEYFVECIVVPTRKETNEDAIEISDISSTVMPTTKRLKLEDNGSVESNQGSSSNSSYNSDSTGPPPFNEIPSIRQSHECHSPK